MEDQEAAPVCAFSCKLGEPKPFPCGGGLETGVGPEIGPEMVGVGFLSVGVAAFLDLEMFLIVDKKPEVRDSD